MKIVRTTLLVALTLWCSFTTIITPVRSAEDAFAPFSVDGNPPNGWYFNNFSLFHYIKAPTFKVYENRDISRNYENLMMCPGKDSDRRDYYCNNQGDECEGGDVDICHKGVFGPQGIAYTAHSEHGSCKLSHKPISEDSDEFIEGKCEYKKLPVVSGKLKGTDFSRENRSLNTASNTNVGEGTETDTSLSGNTSAASLFTGLSYPKYQNEALKYSNYGTDNPITWGSHFLGLSQCDIAVKQVMVLERAKQSKETVAQTGDWPLGWVDWGYITTNNKTLLTIEAGLPANVATAGRKIVDAQDLFLRTLGEESVDYAPSQKIICDTYAQAMAKTKPDTWALDVAQSPVYGPSFRQGYARGSICVWDLCCPGLRCPLIASEELLGNSRRLYYDISISQAFGAALDDLFLNYPLEEGQRLFKKIAEDNPLIRFATSASVEAVPSAIRQTLDPEMANQCQRFNPNTWSAFTTHLDYVKPGDFLAPGCPDYIIQGDLDKQKGGALPESFLQRVIRLLWAGGATGGDGTVDDVEPVKYHLITMPDAMGQSISELEDPVYQSRDILEELDLQNEYNKTLSNIIDASSELFYAGKGIPVGDAKRRLAYFVCDDEMYSSPQSTSIEEYALGTRVGCYEQPAPEGVCDGKLFAELLEKNNGLPTTASSKAHAAFNASIKPKLTPELMNIYGAASAVTGVPCEILAGIHFVEADLDPQGSLVSGRKIGTPEPDAGGKVFKNLLDTAVHAGNELKGKVGGNIKDVATAITALSRYNGGGNSNCQLGYPYPIPYGGCPRQFEGEDDPYPTNWLDARHNTMYLLYCADHTACVPQVFERPGSFTVALEVYNQITKDSIAPGELASPTPKPSSTSTSDTQRERQAFTPETCGNNGIATALGCLPFGKNFVPTLLQFLIGLAGGISIVIMLVATFQIMTAGGNPKQLQKGRELFSSAVVGLLLLIFSVSILRIVAGNIIKLPGF